MAVLYSDNQKLVENVNKEVVVEKLEFNVPYEHYKGGTYHILGVTKWKNSRTPPKPSNEERILCTYASTRDQFISSPDQGYAGVWCCEYSDIIKGLETPGDNENGFVVYTKCKWSGDATDFNSMESGDLVVVYRDVDLEKIWVQPVKRFKESVYVPLPDGSTKELPRFLKMVNN
jgi:hypothetical protein